MAVFWLSLPLCLFFAWNKKFSQINVFLGSAILFLIFNAAVCGALAGVTNRYQCRVAWILPLCLAVYICCLIRERKGVTACR